MRRMMTILFLKNAHETIKFTLEVIEQENNVMSSFGMFHPITLSPKCKSKYLIIKMERG